MDVEVFLLDRSPQRLRGLAASLDRFRLHGVQPDALVTLPGGAVPCTSTEALVSLTLVGHRPSRAVLGPQHSGRFALSSGPDQAASAIAAVSDRLPACLSCVTVRLTR
jgi:hypothetical protein